MDVSSFGVTVGTVSELLIFAQHEFFGRRHNSHRH